MKQQVATFSVLLLSAAVVAQPPSYVPTSGLIAWYPFSGNALDESGNGHDLTVNGAMLADDRFSNTGNAYHFDGVSAYLDRGSDGVFEITGDRTLSVWMKPDVGMTDDQGIAGCIGSSGALAGHTGYLLKRRFVDPNIIGAYEDSALWGNGNYGAAWSDGPCVPGQWHHLVHRRLGGITELWLDGVPQSSTTTITPYFLNSEFLVGWSGSSGQYFNGDIDDIGLWDRALTPAEIAGLFSAGGSGGCLVASYPFDGNALDITGNGHDGTVMGATPAPDRFGNPNGAYQFDGVNDWIRLAGSFNDNAGTVSAWIYMADMTTPNPVFSGRDTTMNGIAVEMTVDPNTGPDASRLSYGLDERDCVGGGCNVYFEIGDPQLSANYWHHVAMTSDGTEVTLYLDCAPITTYFGNCGDGGGLWFDDLCQDVVYMIGRHKRPLSEHFFTGVIDDVRIYDCALTASEIAGICEFNTALPTAFVQPEVRVYPNPTNGQITVSGFASNARADGVGISAFGSPVRIEVKDVTGRLVLVETFKDTRQVQLQLNEPSGVYMLSVQVGHTKTSFRVVKQ